MKNVTRKPPVTKAINHFCGEIRLTDNRTVIVCFREYGSNKYVQARTYNKQKEKGFWYPTKRSYTVPLDHAEAVGKAIIAAATGEMYGPQPDWWAEFEEQYAAFQDERGTGVA